MEKKPQKYDSHWRHLADNCQRRLSQFRGFVIIHSEIISFDRHYRIATITLIFTDLPIFLFAKFSDCAPSDWQKWNYEFKYSLLNKGISAVLSYSRCGTFLLSLVQGQFDMEFHFFYPRNGESISVLFKIFRSPQADYIGLCLPRNFQRWTFCAPNEAHRTTARWSISVR